MRILAIETSCDETALSLAEAKGGIKNLSFKILKNLVASQIKIHAPFGGVVPTLAKREHSKNLPKLFQKIFGISNLQFLISKQISNPKFKILNSLDLIAVTVGPGLEPCLWAGINFAKELKAKRYQLKANLIGVNHLEGHLYSFLLSQKTKSFKFQVSGFKKSFPAVALIVSGGHTLLLLMKDLVHFKKLGETRDDAAGEAFDKIARLLNLPYPGGPEIQKLAKIGKPSIDFPRPMISQKNYDFSFSGLKTAVYYHLNNKQQTTYNKQQKADIAASAQQAIVDVLVSKAIKAARENKAKSIILTGGVAANSALQREFRTKVKRLKPKINFFVPPKKFCTDNAAMIALAAYFDYLTKKSYRLTARGGLEIK